MSIFASISAADFEDDALKDCADVINGLDEDELRPLIIQALNLVHRVRRVADVDDILALPDEVSKIFWPSIKDWAANQEYWISVLPKNELREYMSNS